MRRTLLGNGQRFVVALFDEKPSPEYHLSGKGVYDFYRIGISLLARRSDTVVVIKPKRFDGIPELSEIGELLQRHLHSGRLRIWDHGTRDAPAVIAAADVVVSLIGGTPYLEAICCGKVGFTYDPSGNHTTPLYGQGYRKIIFDDAEEILKAIEFSLDNPSHRPADALVDVIDDLDPYRDFHGVDRMRHFIASSL